MIKASELRNSDIFIYNDEPVKIITYKHTHMGRQGADVRLKFQNLINGSIISEVFAPYDKFDEANIVKKKMQFLYKEGSELIFMDAKNYEQIEVSRKNLGDEIDFLKEGENYYILFWDEKALNIEIPPKVVLKVKECDPGVKGNSAANMYKSAVLENGVKIKVPLFIEPGEKIRVSTEKREYVERAK